MGIPVEFNPDLALRNISEYKKGKHRREECIPENLQKGKIYKFLKRGQRNYFLFDEVPLVETKGNWQISRPLASVKILESTHFLKNGEMWTKGRYKVIEVFDDEEIHFEGFDKLK